MGGSPKTAPIPKTTHSGSINLEVRDNIQFAVSSCQGRRHTQEDAYAVEGELQPFRCERTGNLAPKLQRLLPNHALFSVFDGHGTDFASKYAARHFVSTFCKQSSFLEYSRRFLTEREQQQSRSRKKKGQKKAYSDDDDDDDDDGGALKLLLVDAIKSTMIELDANMLLEMTERNNFQCGPKPDTFPNDDQTELYDIFDSGTTAIIVVLTPQYIVCANLGDSRAILQRTSAGGISVISLSNDHKPNNIDEILRIENAGGEITRGLIEGRLAVSRGLGDFAFKHKPSVLRALNHTERCSMMDDFVLVLPENQKVTSVPEITFRNRAATHDQFIAIASDGVWDVVSNVKCADIVSVLFNEGEQSTALVCEEVLDQCFAKGSLDNMSLILIKFPAQKIGIGGGVMKRRKQRLRNG